MPEREQQLFNFFNEINIIAQLSSNEFERALPDGLTQSQFSVLNWFVRVDSVASPGRLARAFMVTRGAMTNTLKKLEQKGYIEVTPDEASGRSKKITMTATGRQIRDQAIEATFPLFAELAQGFPVDELKHLMPALQKLRTFLDARRYK